MPSSYKQNMTFEADVRRVAEAVWNMEAGSCQPMHYESDPVIRELDGIARLRDVTHLLMVTTSTKLEKAKSDVKKLNAAESIEKSSLELLKCQYRDVGFSCMLSVLSADLRWCY